MNNAFKYRDYRHLWMGSVVSNIGDHMQEVAEDWLILEITGSPLVLGVVSFCKAPSRMILAPLFGVMVDRLNRKTLLAVVTWLQLSLALVYGILVTTRVVRVWHIVMIAVFSGVLAPIMRITRQTVIPDLVPRESLLSAISLNSVGNNTSQVIGPLLGGLCIAAAGVDGVFYVNALSYFAIIISLTIMKFPGQKAALSNLSIRQHLLEGLRFVRSRPVLLDTMSMQFVSFLFALPFNRLLPVYAREIFNIGPSGLGLMRGCFAAGNVVAGLGLSIRTEVRSKNRVLLLASLAMAITMVFFSHSFWFPMSLFWLFMTGASSMVFRSTALSIIQLDVTDEFRGRVMGLYNLEAGFRSFGALFYGASASWIGSPLTVGLGGGIFGLLAMAMRYYRKSRRGNRG